MLMSKMSLMMAWMELTVVVILAHDVSFWVVVMDVQVLECVARVRARGGASAAVVRSCYVGTDL